MQWTYVDNNGTINSTTRSVIRRHAAKGHNVGRKVNRPSRVKALEQRTQPNISAIARSSHVPIETHKDANEGRFAGLVGKLPQIEPVIGDSISILNIPIVVAPEDRELMFEAVAFMRSSRFRPTLAKALTHSNTTHSMFTQLMFRDQAYYHCALAVVAECTKFLPYARTTALRHITQSFRLINERISGASQITNSTLAVVVALSSYDSTRGRYDAGIVHVSGLQRMIEMRGGLDRVGSEEPQLIQKINRLDLDYALHFAASPKLNVGFLENAKAIGGLDIHSVRERSISSMVAQKEFREQLGFELCCLWDMATSLSILINEASTGERAKLPAGEFMGSHVWLGHQLLNYAPLNKSRSLSRIQNIAHLGLVTLISSLLCGLDWRVAENVHLSQLIHDEATLDSASDDTKELLLWLLFIGGTVILQDPAYDTWLLPKAWESMQMLRLHTWNDARKTLSKFPWITDLYETDGLALFNRVASYGSNQGTILEISSILIT